MSQHHRLYCTAAWRRLRLAQLNAKPFCRMCEELGRLVVANIVDHIKAHRGDLALFHDETNLQSLCKPCHDSHKQAQEHSADGILRGARQDGLPIDLSHPFYRAAKAVEPRSCAPTVQTSARLSSPAIGPARAPAAPARGLPRGQGGVKSPTGEASQTASVPSFANCQNSMGGV